MGGKARPQIVRPGAEEAWVEGAFDLPDGLLAEPELADVAERLPEGAEEIVLGRRVSASGRTAAFLAGRAGLRCRSEAARRQAARLLRPARASQADDLLGADGRARTASPAPITSLCARAIARRTASALGWRRSWPSCASVTAPASAT
jgi:hypothetical protein